MHKNSHLPCGATVEKTAKSIDVKEVSADKGYSSLENHNAIARVGATPYIAFKANATGEVGGLFQKMLHFYCFNRDAFLVAYHKRSNAESTFNMIKAKFSTRLHSKGNTARSNSRLSRKVLKMVELAERVSALERQAV